MEWPYSTDDLITKDAQIGAALSQSNLSPARKQALLTELSSIRDAQTNAGITPTGQYDELD